MLENDLISKYFRPLIKNNRNALNLNDDVFYDHTNKVVISLDTYNNKIHFPNFKYPDLVIKKIIRSSLSDLICKGVKPKYYFISASAPKGVFNNSNLKIISKTLNKEQYKYGIKISGGDTTVSNTLSFTVIVLGYSNKIIKRKNSKKNDDIYVTGNIGDSYVGLQIIKNKFKKVNVIDKNFFTKKYYCPEVPYKYIDAIKLYASSSIDISDGIFEDLLKLINLKKYSFKIEINKIPISTKMKNFLTCNNLKKHRYIHKGDDYQILFTAPKKNRGKILNISKKLKQKITIIGQIYDKTEDNVLINGKKRLNIRDFKGYSHKF